MSITYFHNNRDKGMLNNATVAMLLPSKETLTTLFSTHSTQLLIELGYCKVHPNDKFIKKTGRELAASRIKPEPASLENIKIVGTSHVYEFVYRTDSRVLYFSLSTIAESDKVKLLGGVLF